MAFDTERAARRLTDAGLEERAANGVADMVGDATSGLATEARLLATEASLQAKLAATEASLLAKLAATEARLREDTLKLRADMYRALWVQGFGILAGTGAIITIVSMLD